MAHQSPFKLDSMRICVTAEYHNPTILTPEFLKKYQLADSEWVIDEDRVSLVAFRASIPFKNDIIVSADFQEVGVYLFGENTVDKSLEKAKNLIVNYVLRLPYVKYEKLIIGYRAEAEVKEKKELRKFFSSYISSTPVAPFLDSVQGFSLRVSPAIDEEVESTLNIYSSPTLFAKNRLQIIWEFTQPVKPEPEDEKAFRKQLDAKANMAEDFKKQFLSLIAKF